MITWPLELIRLKNELHVTTPWVHCLLLQFRTATNPDIFGSRSVTDHNEPIIFNSIEFTPYPFKLGSVEHNSASELKRLTLSTANIDRAVIALLEEFWTSVLDPLWIVTIWVVNTVNPALTPINSNDKFVILNARTDLFNVSFECQWEGLSLKKIVPSRRYVRSGGFANIPRRVR